MAVVFLISSRHTERNYSLSLVEAMGRLDRSSPRIPARGHLVPTGPVDALDWYYRRGIRIVMRRRLAWVRDALLSHKPDRVLEVGYGSGIFQYELSHLAKVSVGVDIHASASIVRSRLATDGVQSLLVRADGCALPFVGRSFDAVVIVSALEFVPDPEICLRECLRVLRDDGLLVCVTPKELAWADRILQWLVGVKPEDDFRGGRERAHKAIGTVLPDARQVTRPGWLPGWLAPYFLVVREGPREH